jgi:hypothetical protein
LKRLGNLDISVEGIAGHEPSRSRVVVSGAQIVEAEVGVELFAAVIVGARLLMRRQRVRRWRITKDALVPL